MFRVFVGVPNAKELKASTSTDYHWSTHTCQLEGPESLSQPVDESLDYSPLPQATLEAATQRISLLYQNVIFDENEENEPDSVEHSVDLEGGTQAQNETFITWPPSASRRDTTNISFSHLETQETSYGDYSEGSSIMHFPKFHFRVQSLVPLSHLKGLPSGENPPPIPGLLFAVLELTGPDIIPLKKGPDAGKEIHILKMILGSKDGVCKLTAWRDTAKAWSEGDSAIKRGDVIFLENTSLAGPTETGGGIALTASPYLKSSVQVCYRCLPSLPEDRKYRPDLRLAEVGVGDPCVKAVKTLVDWFETTVGLK